MKHRLAAAWLVTICLAAIVPLLSNPHWEFGSDWTSHVYLIGYQSEYLRQHHWFPANLSTDQLVGMPYPVFYAVVFHPAAALLALVAGVDWSVRLIVIALLAAQTWQIRKLLQAVGKSEGLAWLTSASLVWATYAMTNLYTRGALAEFVAISLLTSATASLLRSVLPGENRSRVRLLLQGAFFYALSAGSHPITALFGGLFLVAVLAPLFFATWRTILLPLAAGVVMTMLVLGSWLYALKEFRGSLTVERGTMDKVVHFPDSIDSVASRLWPWPRDIRIEQAGSISLVSTPYLDAQLSLPLALLAVAFSWWMWRGRKRGGALRTPGLWLWGVSWGVFIVAFGLSIWAKPWNWLPGVLRSVQYAYRLVTYQNLALLTVVVGALVAMPAEARDRRTTSRRWFLIGVLVLSLGGATVMMTHVFAIHRPPTWEAARWRENPDTYIHHHPAFYGWSAYSVVGTNTAWETPAQKILLTVRLGDAFGHAVPTRFELAQETSVCVHVQPFPWNQLALDGKSVELSRVRALPQGYILRLPAGTHEVAYRWQPEATWIWLNVLSKLTVLGAGLGLLLWSSGEALRSAMGARGHT